MPLKEIVVPPAADGQRVADYLRSALPDLSESMLRRVFAARDVKLDGDTIVFTLRSYNPRLSELGKYKKADDKDAWFRQMLENMTSYDLELSLPLENGKPTSKGLSALKKAVKAAGEKAKAAFEDNDDIQNVWHNWDF